MEQIHKPWTQKQCDALNAYQKAGRMHPFMCGGNRTDARHLDGEGVLFATPNGWICPYCDYRQDWTHDFMLGPATDLVLVQLAFPFPFTFHWDEESISWVITLPSLGLKTQCRGCANILKTATSAATLWIKAVVERAVKNDGNQKEDKR